MILSSFVDSDIMEKCKTESKNVCYFGIFAFDRISVIFFLFVFSVQIAASCFTYVNGFRLSQPLLQLLTMVATKAIFSLFLEHRHLSHLCHAVPLIHVSPFSFPPPPPECNPLHVSLLESWTFVASLLWPAGLST